MTTNDMVKVRDEYIAETYPGSDHTVHAEQDFEAGWNACLRYQNARLQAIWEDWKRAAEEAATKLGGTE